MWKSPKCSTVQGLPVLQTDPTVLKSAPHWQEEMHLSRARRIRRACLRTVTLCFEKLSHFLWNFAPERLWGSGYTLFWKVESFLLNFAPERLWGSGYTLFWKVGSFFTEFCTGERLRGSGQILCPAIELWRKRGTKKKSSRANNRQHLICWKLKTSSRKIIKTKFKNI